MLNIENYFISPETLEGRLFFNISILVYHCLIMSFSVTSELKTCIEVKYTPSYVPFFSVFWLGMEGVGVGTFGTVAAPLASKDFFG